MKTLLNGSSLLLLLLFVLGCHAEPVSPVDTRTDGCIGVSYYYLNNQSSRLLSIEFTALAWLNGKIDPSATVTSGKTVLIGQDAIFGYIPRPTDTFTAFSLYAPVAGKKTLVYTQQPVKNELWANEKENPNDPDFGCYKVSYTLTITDDLLK